MTFMNRRSDSSYSVQDSSQWQEKLARKSERERRVSNSVSQHGWIDGSSFLLYLRQDKRRAFTASRKIGEKGEEKKAAAAIPRYELSSSQWLN